MYNKTNVAQDLMLHNSYVTSCLRRDVWSYNKSVNTVYNIHGHLVNTRDDYAALSLVVALRAKPQD